MASSAIRRRLSIRAGLRISPLVSLLLIVSSIVSCFVLRLTAIFRRETMATIWPSPLPPRHKFSLLTCLLISVLGLSGCVTVEEDMAQPMRTTIVMSGDIGDLPHQAKTYSWHPQLQKIFTDTRLTSESVLTYMQTVLQQQLQAKGYQYVDNANAADFLVGFGVSIGSTEKGAAPLSDAQILASAGLVAGLSNQGVDTQGYDKGTVLVAVFRPNLISTQYVSDPVIWRSLAQGFADIDDKHQLKERFDALIDEMLIPLPVATQSSILQ